MTLIIINYYSVKILNVQIAIRIYGYEELGVVDRELIDTACQATHRDYAPHSRLLVGAVARLSDNTIVTETNQENVAYPPGFCAGHTASFCANSQYPGRAVEILAIVARDEYGEFLEEPIPPCGACR